MAEAKLQSPIFSIEGNYFIVELGHTPLARPHEIVMEYLDNHDEITNSIGRSLTGITSENTMKEVFYALRNAGQIEMVPGKRGNKSAWQKTQPRVPESGNAPPVALANSKEAVTENAAGELPRTQPGQRTPKRLKLRKVQAGPTRNRPCSCGSGLKYKRCCGAEGIDEAG
ncbi:SEC-C metal-binding domain-containing protein [Streptomyces sp. NPDC002346]